MICGSLFSGVGLFELGLIWSGLVSRVAWQVEIDPFCRAVLARHYPETDRSIIDVRKAGSATLSPVDVICGGFPCQDVSGAGKGAGLAGERSGLWYEYRRIVGELRPRIAIVENVASGKKRWLCEVRSDLHALGYRTRALQISAADVGLPHRRERIFVVAYADGFGAVEPQGGVGIQRRWALDGGSRGDVADANGAGAAAAEQRRQRGCAVAGGEALADAASSRREGPERGSGESAAVESAGYAARHWSALPHLGRSPHGLPDRVDRAPAGRGAEQHGWEPPRTASKVKHRPARLKALGNGIVPQCVEAVGRMIVAEMLTMARGKT
mgnify:CR=1 FL=1